jgi:hypothetical protein
VGVELKLATHQYQLIESYIYCLAMMKQAPAVGETLSKVDYEVHADVQVH